ncbi:unnamed protein product, partial [Candidula unifasciata]
IDMMTCQRWPWPRWTAYWTPPPSWPRRLLCENRYICTCSKSGWRIFAGIMLTYFLVMDVLLFTSFKSTNLVTDSKGGKLEEIYTPITHLSIKALLNDHPSQFIIAPSTEYFNFITKFSSVFSFITPNMISVGHLIIGFVACKFIASENLQDRRIGVILYEYRTWVDALDGTVHRAQDGLHLQYHSDHSTFGYAVDSLFDTLGGIFLCFGIFFYLLKTSGPEKSHLPLSVSARAEAGSGEVAIGPTSNGLERNKALYSLKVIVWKSLTFGVCLAVAGKCWDVAVEEFTQVLQVEIKNDELANLQRKICHSAKTVVIFYLWRLFGGQSVLNYVLLAIYMDKVLEFLSYIHYLLLLAAGVLYVVTAVYLQHIRDVLHLPH